MNNDMDTDKIRRLLDHSAGQLDQAALDRLRDARELAMQHYAPNARGRQEWTCRWRHSPAAWVGTLLLTVSLFGGGVYYWDTHDNSEVDVAILTDDLPANVYVN